MNNIEKAAYTYKEFCQLHGFSLTFLYELLKKGQGPRIIKVAGRRLISREAAAEWRQRWEQSAA
jgi:predicted DNA-binding transcriptional regulator AlpA